MGGGLGLLPPEPAFYRGLAALPGVHTTVVTGKNQKLYQRLVGRYEGLTVLGYVDNVGELMASADLMVSKAGGVTLFESLFRALPLLVPEPTLQQEVHNAAWAEAHGVAAVAPRDPEGCLDAIVRLLADRNGLERMSKAAGQVCRTLEPHGLARCLKRLEKEGERHAA